jgi:hypothetical protein
MRGAALLSVGGSWNVETETGAKLRSWKPLSRKP